MALLWNEWQVAQSRTTRRINDGTILDIVKKKNAVGLDVTGMLPHTPTTTLACFLLLRFASSSSSFLFFAEEGRAA